MARVYLPTPLAAFITGLPKQTEAPGATVLEILEALEARWPGVFTSLCSSQTVIRPHINVYVDGARATLADVVRPDSVVKVLTAVSGG